jgi:2-polyprenyl-3-methyl-5-hydroxy-6-metoxy-1,4-benzoquinol methylase
MTTNQLILDQSPKQALDQFLQKYQEVGGQNIEEIKKIALATIRHLNGNKDVRFEMAKTRALEKRWYQSLTKGQPDWDVYASDLYMAELWGCWIVYSRSYLRNIISPTSMVNHSVLTEMGPIKTVVDLGCGFGLTTAAWKQICPKAQVYGTNLDGTIQMKMAHRMAKEYKFQMVSELDQIEPNADVVFASEYFEHIPTPVQHLRNVLKKLKPQNMLIANAFGTQAIGHFPRYRVNGQNLDGKQTSTAFNAELKKFGFAKVKTQLWNNRPNFWKRGRVPITQNGRRALNDDRRIENGG